MVFIRAAKIREKLKLSGVGKIGLKPQHRDIESPS
jgi:hypothetical protein